MTSILAQLEPYLRSGQRACGIDLQRTHQPDVNLDELAGDALDFSHSDLNGALFERVHFANCRLCSVQMADSNWTGASLRACVLDGARAAGARFDGARLEDSSAKGIDLCGASLQNAHLSETSFERAMLRGAVLDGASGEGVVFRGADLAGAGLRGARFNDADFRGCDLRGADLSGGCFQYADFRGALLDDARLAGADLLGAQFDPEPAASQASSKADPDQASAAYGVMETLLRDLARQLEGGQAAPSALLAGLMKQAGLSAAHEQAPDQAAMLRQLLDGLRELQAPAVDPAEQVRRCQSLLEQVLPQLRESLGAADWQVLTGLLSQLQDQAASAAAEGVARPGGPSGARN